MGDNERGQVSVNDLRSMKSSIFLLCTRNGHLELLKLLKSKVVNE